MENLLVHYEPGDELEIRFGTFNEIGKYNASLPYLFFGRLSAAFSTRDNITREVSTVESQGEKRRITIGNKVILQTKEKIFRLDGDHTPYRAAISKERVISNVEAATFISKAESVRVRNRTSIVLDSHYRLDLTIIEGDEPKYEAELELLENAPLDLEELRTWVLDIFKIMWRTPILYTEDERKEAIKKVNVYLSPPNSRIYGTSIDNRNLVQTIPLPLSSFPDIITNTTSPLYSITQKADGERRILYFGQVGIWLLYPPNDVALIARFAVPDILETVMEVESISIPNRLAGSPVAEYYLIAFDHLVMRGEKLQRKEYLERMQLATEIESDYNLSVEGEELEKILHLDIKPYLSWSDSSGFYYQVNKLLDQKNILSFKTDGLILTPIGKYGEGTTYKWKPLENQTIDFAIYRDEKGKLDIYSWKGTYYTPFEGDDRNPWYGNVEENKLVAGLADYTVVEFEYKNDTFSPVRVRFDKPYPNNIRVAQDIWRFISDPFKESSLRGNDDVLFRRYHNRIKNSLLNEVDLGKGEYTLLDLGSGRGGDVGKWKNFSRIVAVEPNEEYRKELVRRVKENGLQSKVRIVAGTAEETEKIVAAVIEFIGARVSMVAMMDVLPLAAKDEHTFDMIMGTVVSVLSARGAFLFKTIDGTRIGELFPEGIMEEVRFGDIVMRVNHEDSTLFVDIPGSIVSRQTENLIYINDIVGRLAPFGYKTSQIRVANKDNSLPNEYAKFSALYTYGYITGEGVKDTPIKIVLEAKLGGSITKKVRTPPVIEVRESVVIPPPARLTPKKGIVLQKRTVLSLPAPPPPLLPWLRKEPMHCL